MVDFEDVREAYKILKPIVKHTPLEKSKTFSSLIKKNIYLKLRIVQEHPEL